MKQSHEERKVQYLANKGRAGSKFIKIYRSETSSPKHRKDYRAKQGKLATRIIQSLAGRDWRGLEVA